MKEIEVTPEMISAGVAAYHRPPDGDGGTLTDAYRAMRRLAPTTEIISPDYVGPERRRRFMAPK